LGEVKNMKQREFAELVKKAETVRLGDTFGREAGAAADVIHSSDHPIIMERGAIALIKWQCLCMDGSWDQEALTETAAFMRKATIVPGPVVP
jgi:hypothetical protein